MKRFIKKIFSKKPAHQQEEPNFLVKHIMQVTAEVENTIATQYSDFVLDAQC